MNIDIINMIMKNFFINMFSLIIFYRIINYRNLNLNKKIYSFILIFILTTCNIILKKYFDNMLTIIISYFIQSIMVNFLVNAHLSKTMVAIVFAISLSYFIFIISGAIEFIFQTIFDIKNTIINLILTFVLGGILLYAVNKIKRFNKGFKFFQNNLNNDYIDIIMVNISAIVILAYCLLGDYYGDDLTKHIFISLIILGIFMIIMIEKSLVLCYKQNLLKRTIEDYETNLKEKDNKIKELSDELFKTSKVNHEFHNRISALELKVKDFTSNNSVEFGEELGVLNRIKDLEKEYSSRVQEIKGKDELPLTGICELDDMFKYMQSECIKNNISFNLKINGNIYYLINNIIKKNKLETLIGDHIKDAIIAINSGNNTYKSILVILGKKDKCYELCIYDTGVEFKIDTLLKLGLEPTTTHKEDGGSGIGFVTTFETLKECKASLIIQERHLPNKTDYTKSVTVRFDGKNEYKILSYRAEDIKSQSKRDRIIIEKY